MQGNVPVNKCNMYFSILEDELHSGISVEILQILSNWTIFFDSAKRMVHLFAKEKKDSDKIKYVFFFLRKLQILSEGAWIRFVIFIDLYSLQI